MSDYPCTYLFITLLLPLRDEHSIGVVVLEEPVVQFLVNGFLFVIEVVDVFRAWVTSKSAFKSS